MTAVLDGLVTFFSWHHAIRAEKVLLRDGYAVKLIPGPREISPNCGTALRFQHNREQAACQLLEREKVQIEATHQYVPPFETEPEATGKGERGVPFWPRWTRRWS